MTLELKVNPMLNGALSKDEFLEQYSRYLKEFYISSRIDATKNYHYDYLYNQYLEAYKYGSKEDYKRWLGRRNSK